jgi:hypothetical protein
MAESEPVPEVGAIRHAQDGALEVFDGQGWAPYRPPRDFFSVRILKGFENGEAPLDISDRPAEDAP